MSRPYLKNQRIPKSLFSASPGLTARAGQNINLSQSSGETNISQRTVQEMWWYVILPNGRKQVVVYCNRNSCSYEPCYGKLCPKCLPRLKMEGMSLILANVQQADQGLQLQRRIEPRVNGKMTGEPKVQMYDVTIKEVLTELPTG